MKKEVVVLDITLASGLITPDQLPLLIAAAEAALPGAGGEGVVLSGRMPVWAFAALVHLYHPRPWVATFEPRLGAGVVVASHAPGVGIGSTVDISAATSVAVVFN